MTEDANGWHLIDPPPQDGMAVDLWNGILGCRIIDCRYVASMNSFMCGSSKVPWFRITHWRYPPKPPVEFERE